MTARQAHIDNILLKLVFNPNDTTALTETNTFVASDYFYALLNLKSDAFINRLLTKLLPVGLSEENVRSNIQTIIQKINEEMKNRGIKTYQPGALLTSAEQTFTPSTTTAIVQPQMQPSLNITQTPANTAAVAINPRQTQQIPPILLKLNELAKNIIAKYNALESNNQAIKQLNEVKTQTNTECQSENVRLSQTIAQQQATILQLQQASAQESDSIHQAYNAYIKQIIDDLSKLLAKTPEQVM